MVIISTSSKTLKTSQEIQVYTANTTTSVLSIGQTKRRHHLEWLIRGETMTIVTRRTNDGYTLPISTENLYPLPSELLDPIPSTTAVTTESAETPHATGTSTPSRTTLCNHPIQKEIMDTTPPSPPPFKTTDRRRKKKRRFLEDDDTVPALLTAK